MNIEEEKARGIELEARLRFRPIHDNVVILLHEKNRQTKGGIFIPDTAKGQDLMRATVVRCGPGTESWPVTVKPGDVVLVGEKHRPGREVGEPVVGGDDAESQVIGLKPGEEMRVVRENEIVAVLE